MKDERDCSVPVGTLYLTGDQVENGEVDLDDALDYLKGVKDTLKFYIERQDKSLVGKNYSIEVRIRPGSLITDVIGLTGLAVAGGIVIYGKTALTEIAKNDAKDKTSADVARSAVSTLKTVLRIAKHFGAMAKRKLSPEEAHVVNDKHIELINKKGERMIVTLEEFEAYRKTPPTKLRQLVTMVGHDTALYVDDKQIEPGKIPESAEAVQYKDKKIFDDRDIDLGERVMYPELVQDMCVVLEGELTRGNARTDTLGFSYDGHILKAVPSEGGVKAMRDMLFGPVRLEAVVDRRSTAKGSHAVLKKPILRIVSIEPIENSTDSYQQTLL